MQDTDAITFTYDGVPSEKYGLFICRLDTGDVFQLNENHTPKTLSLPRIYNRVFLGYEDSEPLTFELLLASETPIDANIRQAINRWLIRRNGYKEFRINREDYYNVYFKCIFTNQETMYVADTPYVIKVTAICDSPYQYGKPVITKCNSASNAGLILNNISDIDGYVFPQIKISMSSQGGDIAIVNTTDDINREFKFEGLSGNEIITIDNARKVIVSSLGIRRIESFNKKWLRLVSGINNLEITGSANIEIEIPTIKRVGM